MEKTQIDASKVTSSFEERQPALSAGARGGPPVFIVGCPRSGTTLLRVMLDAHPDLAIPPESHFIPAVWRVRRRYESRGRMDAGRLVGDILRTHRFREWGLPADAVWRRVHSLPEPTFADVIRSVFLAYADEQGKRRWGDKTTNYCLDVQLLSELFPDARFVHVIRDGRSVAMSLVEAPWWPWRLAEAASVWVRWTRSARAQGRALGEERYVEARYEDLIDDPDAVLRRLCAFADLPFRREMRTYHERLSRTIPASERTIHQRLADPIRRDLRDWQRDMVPEDLALVEAIAGRLLAELGYETSNARLAARVRLRALTELAVAAISHGGRELKGRAVRIVHPDALPQPRRR